MPPMEQVFGGLVWIAAAAIWRWRLAKNAPRLAERFTPRIGRAASDQVERRVRFGARYVAPVIAAVGLLLVVSGLADVLSSD